MAQRIGMYLMAFCLLVQTTITTAAERWSWLDAAEGGVSRGPILRRSHIVEHDHQDYRWLEDNNAGGNDGGGYYMDMSRIRFGKCVRVKIREDNDDDGNSYFYNGAYRSQSVAYASFYGCHDDNDNDDGSSSSGQCGVCETSVEYVMQLDQFLEETVDFMQNYCNTCLSQCVEGYDDDDDANGGDDDGGGNNQAQQQINVDCNVCVEQCVLFTSGNDGNDETQYLNCQEAFAENDIQYYSGPTCDSDGGIIMGLFYDNECTIKHTNEANDYSEEFAYNTFLSIENMCTSCDDSYICGELMGESLACDYEHSSSNKNNNKNNDDEDGGDDDDEDQHICNRYKEVSKEHQYATRRRHYSPVGTILFVVVLIGAFFFLSYTYYVRHDKNNAARAPLVDPQETEEQEHQDQQQSPTNSPSTENGNDDGNQESGQSAVLT